MRDIIKKAIYYRIMIVVSQLIFLYILTNELVFSVGISGAFAIIATIEHIIFEKIYTKNG